MRQLHRSVNLCNCLHGIRVSMFAGYGVHHSYYGSVKTTVTCVQGHNRDEPLPLVQHSTRYLDSRRALAQSKACNGTIQEAVKSITAQEKSIDKCTSKIAVWFVSSESAMPRK